MKFVIASKHKEFKDTITGIHNYGLQDKEYVHFVGDNSRSLPVVYNEAIDKFTGDLLVFIHDDVILNLPLKSIISRLEYKLEYDVIGLAGTKAITIKEPVLWHLMSGREHHLGCVAHGTADKYQYTSFGPIPGQAVLVDGVFIAVNTAKCKVRFDEKIPSKFHFYDLCFSLDCNLAKHKVGVVDIPIIHSSPGLKEVTPEWLAGQKYFLEKYSKFKNQTITV